MRREALNHLVLAGAALLLGSGAAAEDIVEVDLTLGKGFVDGEVEQRVAKNQEIFGRAEPPSFCRQSQLEAAVGVTTTHVRRVNLTGGVYQDHHDHSQQRCDVAPQFALVHTHHVP